MTAAAASDAWLEMARAVPIESEVARRGGLGLKRRGKELIGPCPRCGGDDRFAVNIVKQLFLCRQCGAKGDVIDLVQHLDGSDFTAAVTTLTGRACKAGASSDTPEPATAGRAHLPLATNDNLDLADAIWRATQPLGPEAIAYFAGRNIDIDAAPEHGGLRFYPRHQCIVGRFTTAIGNQPRGIWRRPLTGDKPKSLGPMAGCVIRLWPDEAVELGLVLGEGVETTLAAATCIDHRGTLLQPAWAACSAGNMESFPVLSGIEALTLLVDNDANNVGQKAAAACCARWIAAGREVTRLMPRNVDSDLNDLTFW
jgi:phage/plasmid primase-like uncharacterized protein